MLQKFKKKVKCFVLYNRLTEFRNTFRTNQISKMELFVKMLQPLTIFTKSSILDVWLDSEYVSGNSKKSFTKFKNSPMKVKKGRSLTH